MIGTAQARIDLDALRHNLARARSAAPGRKLFGVLKANAYGHGAIRVARALAGRVDGFAVARIEEALELREAGIGGRMLLLEGVFAGADLALVRAHDLDIVIHHESQIEMLERAGPGAAFRVWLKIDTGMSRLGFPPGELDACLARIRAAAPLAEPVRIMTHLAYADDRRDSATERQLERFHALVHERGLELSIANSAGLLGWPASHGDWVRPGLMLYGISPFVGSSAEHEGLRPVMTLATRLIAVNQVRQGASVGYAGRWVCPEDMAVGVAAVGYGDGYPRHAASGTPVLVNEQLVTLIGRVSMDMITLDLRSQPDARPGDPVTLWGRGLPVEEIARHAGTIPYELVCRVTRRVHFVEEG